MLLSQAPEDSSRMHFRLGSDGRGSRYIEVPAGGTRLPVDEKVLQSRAHKFRMDGPKVWEFAVDAVPRAIRALLADHGMAPGDLDLLVLHQSNLRMIEAIMQSLGLPMDRTVTTLEIRQHRGGQRPHHLAQGLGDPPPPAWITRVASVDSAAACPGAPLCSAGDAPQKRRRNWTGNEQTGLTRRVDVEDALVRRVLIQMTSPLSQTLRVLEREPVEAGGSLDGGRETGRGRTTSARRSRAGCEERNSRARPRSPSRTSS